jgi:hypothetical protein
MSKTRALSFLAALLLASPSSGWCAADPASGAKAFEIAWAASDAQKMGELFADNAELLDPFGKLRRRRVNIEALLKEQHRDANRFMNGSRFKIVSRSQQPLPGVSACAQLPYPPVLQEWDVDLIDMKDARGARLKALHMHVLVIWVNQSTGTTPDWYMQVVRCSVPAPSPV